MTNWYALMDTGSIEHLGEFEDFWAADEGCPGNKVWIVDEEIARLWLKQLEEMLPKEVIQALRDMSLYVGDEFESGSAWDSPPKYCPFCGGKNIYNDVALWSSVSEDDQNNKAVLDEHQCKDCGGRSFWT